LSIRRTQGVPIRADTIRHGRAGLSRAFVAFLVVVGARTVLLGSFNPVPARRVVTPVPWAPLALLARQAAMPAPWAPLDTLLAPLAARTALLGSIKPVPARRTAPTASRAPLAPLLAPLSAPTASRAPLAPLLAPLSARTALVGSIKLLTGGRAVTHVPWGGCHRPRPPRSLSVYYCTRAPR